MRLFEFDRDRDEPRTLELDREAVETEWQLESWLHANPEVILNEPLLIFGRQYSLSTGLPDLLALDQWGNVVVVELKKGQSGSGSASEETILSQPQNYASDLSNYEYADLEDIYREYKANVRDEWEVSESAVVEDTLKEAHETALGGDVEESEFNTHQRMVILAEEITSRTENNARYLLEQGLAVQCVAVQRFETDDEREFLVASTVVDYPLSRVQPEDSKVDYSHLIRNVRDRVFAEVSDVTRHERPGDMSGAASRRLGFHSQHPEHPDSVLYRFTPRMVEQGRATVSIGLFGSDTDEKDQVREVVAAHAGELEGYKTSDEHRPNSNLVYLEFEMLDREPDEEFVEAVAEEMTRLIQHYHPLLVEEVGSE
ncbi:hypothetical protein ACFQMF_03175 [Halorubrum rutilum]|uniref:DUF91 domain-containing protein n=1 Tax=Halorubrum rutilum TaxID=1364933 RepID=A0ABD6AH77_9EURY|nr:hypothetical protein [Halorubrum rutilum]